jgi:hypothetical protein
VPFLEAEAGFFESQPMAAPRSLAAQNRFQQPSPLRGDGVVTRFFPGKEHQIAKKPPKGRLLRFGCGGPHSRYVRPSYDQNLLEIEWFVVLMRDGVLWRSALLMLTNRQ